jgi:hypothetical protein
MLGREEVLDLSEHYLRVTSGVTWIGKTRQIAAERVMPNFLQLIEMACLGGVRHLLA